VDNTKTVSINGLLNTNLIPSGNGSIDLGSASHYYNTIYANSINLPVGNGTSGFWTITNNTNLYPSNAADDLLIGGSATGSATFQVFAQTVGTTAGGTASTSGNLVFNGTSPKINLLNGQGLTIQSSTGGDTGLSSIVTISNTGDLTLNGGNIMTNASTANIFTSNITSLTIGRSSASTTLNGNLTLGSSSSNTINLTGEVNSSIIPSTTATYDLGSASLTWKNIYASNLYTPITGGISGFWQLQNGVLAPTNIQNDLAIGGNATSSAKFQIFGDTGNATTSGNLTFNTTGVIQTTNNQGLTIGGNTTGNITLSPLNGSGTTTLNSNTISAGNITPSATDTYDLGSATKEWNNLYVRQIISPASGGISGYWQLNSGVLAPVNV
jgi:hypothetical protein